MASDVGGISEQIRHGQEGLLVSPGDPVELSEACLCLLLEPERARQLGEAGRRRALCHFGFGTMLRRIEAVYDVVLDHPEARPEPAIHLEPRIT